MLGIIGYNWPAGLNLTDQWQQINLDWTSVGGDLRAIIKNEVVQTKSLLIDDVTVTEIPPILSNLLTRVGAAKIGLSTKGG